MQPGVTLPLEALEKSWHSANLRWLPLEALEKSWHSANLRWLPLEALEMSGYPANLCWLPLEGKLSPKVTDEVEKLRLAYLWEL